MDITVKVEEVRAGDRFENPIGELQWIALGDAVLDRRHDVVRIEVQYRDMGIGHREFDRSGELIIIR